MLNCSTEGKIRKTCVPVRGIKTSSQAPPYLCRCFSMKLPIRFALLCLTTLLAVNVGPVLAQHNRTPSISICMPVHGSDKDRFVVADFKKVGPARYDITYKVIQCPTGACVWKKTLRNRIVLPSAAINGRLVTTCPAEFLHFNGHPHLKQQFFRGSIFDDYGRHLKRHFNISRNDMGHLIYSGPHEKPRKKTYLRMRLDQLCIQ